MGTVEIKNLVPNLNAPIVTEQSVAGIDLGMSYSSFLAKTNHVFIKKFPSNDSRLGRLTIEIIKANGRISREIRYGNLN